MTGTSFWVLLYRFKGGNRTRITACACIAKCNASRVLTVNPGRAASFCSMRWRIGAQSPSCPRFSSLQLYYQLGLSTFDSNSGVRGFPSNISSALQMWLRARRYGVSAWHWYWSGCMSCHATVTPNPQHIVNT